MEVEKDDDKTNKEEGIKNDQTSSSSAMVAAPEHNDDEDAEINELAQILVDTTHADASTSSRRVPDKHGQDQDDVAVIHELAHLLVDIQDKVHLKSWQHKVQQQQQRIARARTHPKRKAAAAAAHDPLPHDMRMAVGGPSSAPTGIAKTGTAAKRHKSSHHKTAKDRDSSTTMTPQATPLPTVPEQQQQIARAAALVSRSLLLGAWPSPYRPYVRRDPDGNNSMDVDDHDDDHDMYSEGHGRRNYPRHRAHMSMVGASLEKFANDIIGPALVATRAAAPGASPQPSAQQQQQQRQPQDNKSSNIQLSHPRWRAFLGALLLFRELLCQNAATIFGPVLVDDDLAGEQAEKEQKEKDDDDDEAAFFATQVLATAIVLTGLSDAEAMAALSMSSGGSGSFVDLGRLKNDFLDLVDSYECVVCFLLLLLFL